LLAVRGEARVLDAEELLGLLAHLAVQLEDLLVLLVQRFAQRQKILSRDAAARLVAASLLLLALLAFATHPEHFVLLVFDLRVGRREQALELGELLVLLGERVVSAGERLVLLAQSRVTLGQGAVFFGQRLVLVGEGLVLLDERLVLVEQRLIF